MGAYQRDIREYNETGYEEYPGEIGVRIAELEAFNAALKYLGYTEIPIETWADPNAKAMTEDARAKTKVHTMTERIVEAFLKAAARHPSSANVTFGGIMSGRS